MNDVAQNFSLLLDVRILAASNGYLKKQVIQGSFREDLFYRINVLTITAPPLRDRMEDIPLLARFFLTRFRTDFSSAEEIFREALMCLENYEWPGNVRELENIIRRAIALGKNDVVQPDDLPRKFCVPPPNTLKSLAPAPADSLVAYEIAAIQNALAKKGNNRSKASKILRIGEATLYRKIKKYGIVS